MGSSTSIEENFFTHTNKQPKLNQKNNNHIHNRLNRKSLYINKNQTILLLVGYLRLNQVFNEHQYIVKEISKLILAFYCLNTIKIFKHKDNKFDEIDLPQNSNINPVKSFNCNGSSYFAILNNNELYVKGGNCGGQLGLGMKNLPGERTKVEQSTFIPPPYRGMISGYKWKPMGPKGCGYYKDRWKYTQETWIKHSFFNDHRSVKLISYGMISSRIFMKTMDNKLY
eukprot:420942_1